MVSSVLKISSEELVALLKDFSVRYADDPEWQELRRLFPADWPM